MQALGLVGVVAMMTVGVAVGLRLLQLAGRTRQLPELCAGLGLLLVCGLGHPFAVAGRTGGLVGTALGNALFGLGVGLASAGIALIYAFTWRVFRPRAAWARRVVTLAALTLAVQTAGIVRASTRARALPEILPLTRPWAIAIVATTGLGFAWTGVESARHHARLRRRLALGLADPVVVNRFLLWELSAAAVVVLTAAVGGCLAARMAVLAEPAPLIAVACAGLVASAGWALAFLPPASYVRWLARRSPPCSSRSGISTQSTR